MSYYAIIRYHGYTGRKEYLGYQEMPWFDKTLADNYIFLPERSYRLNVGNHDAKKHPTYFRSKKKAWDFVSSLKNLSESIIWGNLHVEKIPDEWIPSCGWDCINCNKKHKLHCHNLKYDRQNICGFIMADIPEDYICDEDRWDAPCEVCRTHDCVHIR